MPAPKPSTPAGSRRDLPRVALHVTPDELRALDALAQAWGCSRAEALRRAALEAAARVGG